jgi:UDP-N-acetylglucosamine:LPS N-acetylglucosamine transferase
MAVRLEGTEVVPDDVQLPVERRRVLVVSASMGAGHHGVADEIVRRLRQRGHHAERIDVLDLGEPGQGDRLRRTYAFLLRRLPWVYDLAMRFWARWPRPLERLTAHGAAAFERGLLGEIERIGPDVVVSVYNLSSQALGRMRSGGLLHTPVVTYVTDPGAHPYWVHPAVDLHLATLPRTAQALEGWGARRAAVVRPLVAEGFADGVVAREQTRRRLGVPAEGRMVLVSAGSWAVGEVERTVDLLARTGSILPVTLCGRNDALRDRLSRRGIGVPLGWTDDMASLMAAADVFVDNAGGLTCWEALVSGLPVVVFRPLPGHGRFNAEALERAGCTAYARTDGELISLIDQLSRCADDGRREVPTAPVMSGGDVVTEVLDVCTDSPGRRVG